MALEKNDCLDTSTNSGKKLRPAELMKRHNRIIPKIRVILITKKKMLKMPNNSTKRKRRRRKSKTLKTAM